MVALGDTPVLIALRKQMDAAGYKPKVMDFARGAQLQQFSDALGPLAEGIVIDSYWTPETGYPGAAELGARFDKEADFSIGQMVGPSYATGQILMDAITAANSTDPQKIVDAIAATDGEYVCGPIKFDANHTATLQSLLTQWQSGKSEIIWPDGHGHQRSHLPASLIADERNGDNETRESGPCRLLTTCSTRS